MREYSVIRVPEQAAADGSCWAAAPRASIDTYRWGEDGVGPAAYGQMVRTPEGFWVHFAAWEGPCLRAEARGISPDVYLDNAAELFWMPSPETTARYFNLEFNSAGALYVGVGTCRGDNVLLRDEDIRTFQISNEVRDLPGGKKWTVTAKIPDAFVRRQLGPIRFEPGARMRGNFYKCADGTPRPHYGAWNEVLCPAPDFHRPEYFGGLTLV